MNRLRLLRGLLAVVVVFTLVAACAGPASTPTEAPSEPESGEEVEEPTEEPEEEPTEESAEEPASIFDLSTKPSGTIVVQGWTSGLDVFRKSGVMDDFYAEYPDIEVEWSEGVDAEAFQLALMSGEGLPDVTMLQQERIQHWIEFGGLLDVTEGIEPHLDRFVDFPKEFCQEDGRWYMVPWDIGPVVWYYRRDVFEDAGLPTEPEEVNELVKTWDDFIEVCETIKEETGLMCMAENKANNNGELYESMMWQQGIGYFDEEGNCTFDSAENLRTLEVLGELWEKDLLSNEQVWSDPWYEVLSSKETPVAGVIEASWLGVFLKTWIAGGTEGLWGVARMPAMEEGQVRAANHGGSGLAIPEDAPNVRAAWAFVEFMLLRDDPMVQIFEYSDFLPSLKTTYDDPVFTEAEDFFDGQVARKVYLDVGQEIPAAAIYHPDHQKLLEISMLAIQKYATGALSAEEALSEAAETMRQETRLE